MASLAAPEQSAPSGLVTFLFTDVEGSTQLWAADAAAMGASLAVHDALVRDACEARGGYVFTTAGDSFSVAFGRATDAVLAARDAQKALAGATWPGPALRVRMGLHLGETVERDGDYFGPVVNLTARLESAGHGGQILISEQVRLAAEEEIGDALDLGVHDLRDVPAPVQIYQLGEESFPPLRLVMPNRTNLPIIPSRLIGRDAAVGQTRHALSEERLVTLTAAGGAGKTRLALAVGEAELTNWRDGVWFIDLRTVSDERQVAAAVASTLQLRLVPGDPTDQVASFLSGVEMLVILDNCEHLTDACAELAEAVLGRPGPSRILATSREFLDIDGERVLRLDPLPTEGDDNAAVLLFAQRAAEVNPDFRLGPDVQTTIAQLCRRLDGSPLAIELAAARSNVMTSAELLAGIDERFELLSGGRRGGRRRRARRTLEDTLAWSYDLLDVDEQSMFRALGAFAGDFDMDAAAVVADLSRRDAADLMESLIAKSLVVSDRVDDVSRFRLLETTRAYARRMLDIHEEAESAKDRHLAHYRSRCEGFIVSFVTNEGAGVLLPERTNLNAALDHAVSLADWASAARILHGAWTVWRGLPDGVLDVIDVALPHLDELDPLAAVTLRHLSIFKIITELNDFKRAMAVLAELGKSPHPYGAPLAGLWQGFATLHISPSDGLEVLRTTTALTSAFEDPEARRQAIGLINTFEGFAFSYAGSFDRAIDALGRGLQQADDSQVRSAWAVIGEALLCVSFLASGRQAEAEAVIESIENAGDLSGQGGALRTIIEVLTGDLDAAEILLKAHAGQSMLGRLPREANDTLLLMAILANRRGDAAEARDLLLSVGIAQSPATIALSLHLSRELDIEKDFGALRLLVTGDPLETSRAARRRLGEEVAKRGW